MTDFIYFGCGNVGNEEQRFKVVQNNVKRKNYAIRRIRDAFKANKNLQDCDAIEAAYNEAFSTLAIIKRQVVVSNLYKSDKLIIENYKQ